VIKTVLEDFLYEITLTSKLPMELNSLYIDAMKANLKMEEKTDMELRIFIKPKMFLTKESGKMENTTEREKHMVIMVGELIYLCMKVNL